MKKIKGQSINISNHIIGKVTHQNNIFLTDKILIAQKVPKILIGVNALILSDMPKHMPKIPVFISDSTELFQNDIVNISSDGNCSVIWEANSTHNALFVTDACNSKCIMCPQPMPEKPINYFQDNMKVIKLLDRKYVQSVGITGGEPTLNIKELCKLLENIKDKAKNIPVQILTNGRLLADEKKLNEILKINNTSITYGIPLYSNTEDEHDFIVGCKGAFNETLKGLYNLAKAKQKVEIRIVVLKQNYAKLVDIAEFIYRNLPFVTHVAIMTMEYTGLAEENFKDIFVDPIEYKEHLYGAIRQFVRYNILASVYNTPLCLLDKRIWSFSTDSISDWKKTYIEKCQGCTMQSDCCGVFDTSFTQSTNISKINQRHDLCENI